MDVKLAEALLRRKELQGKVDMLKQITLLTASQVTHEYDWHARQLRLVDAAIQRANWTCEVVLDPAVMGDYPGQPERAPRGKA